MLLSEGELWLGHLDWVQTPSTRAKLACIRYGGIAVNCTLSAVRYLHGVNAETCSVVSLLLTEAEGIVSHCQTAYNLLQQIHRAAVVADIYLPIL